MEWKDKQTIIASILLGLGFICLGIALFNESKEKKPEFRILQEYTIDGSYYVNNEELRFSLWTVVKTDLKTIYKSEITKVHHDSLDNAMAKEHYHAYNAYKDYEDYMRKYNKRKENTNGRK